MAREILFRGKRTDNGEWIEGHLIIYPKTKRTKIMVWEWADLDFDAIEVRPKTVGQFTGLNDKNGKKVFEGDILSSENGTFSNTGMGYILFYKGMWTSFYGQDGIGRDCFDELHTVCNSREVTGNIHDNPELLYGTEP